jgi:hypothetical protein
MTGGSQFYGQGLCRLKDIDGDGRDDLAVSDPSYGAGKGIVYAYSSGDWGVLWSSSGGSAGDMYGEKLVSVGDYDADGYPDVAVVSFRASRARVVSGLSGQEIMSIECSTRPSVSGQPVASIGDLNGDGVPELAVEQVVGHKVFTRVLSVVKGEAVLCEILGSCPRVLCRTEKGSVRIVASDTFDDCSGELRGSLSAYEISYSGPAERSAGGR